MQSNRLDNLIVPWHEVDSLVAPSNSVTLDVQDNALYWLLA